MVVHELAPKISCLLVTANGRLEFFRRSVRCYADQTYPDRELVVLNEGPHEYQQQLAEVVAGVPGARTIFLDGRYSLGSLRNISIALCRGDLFCQWDDDDYNTPERLAVQYAHLARNPSADVCFLSDQLHFYWTTKELYWENWARFHSGGHLHYSLIPGTVMAWRKRFLWRYPSGGPHCSAGEDSVMAVSVCETGNVALAEGLGAMHVYTYHGANVWDLEHHQKISRERALPIADMVRHRRRICRALEYLGFGCLVRVMGREGLAYEVES